LDFILFFHFHFITLDLDIYDGHMTPSLLSLLLLSCMVVSIRELANILYPVTISSTTIMKFKKSYSKKFAFDLPVSQSSSILPSLSSLRNVTSNTFMSDMNYVERAVQIANILVDS